MNVYWGENTMTTSTAWYHHLDLYWGPSGFSHHCFSILTANVDIMKKVNDVMIVWKYRFVFKFTYLAALGSLLQQVRSSFPHVVSVVVTLALQSRQASVVQCTDSVVCGFSCFVAWQIFSFPIRYGTCVPYISRRILTHREVPQILLTLKGSWGPSGVWGSSLENHCFPSVVLNEAEEGDPSSFQRLWATSGDIFGCHHWWGGSVQFSSVAQSCPTLCDPMNRSTPGLPVHPQLPEFTQTHVHRVSDAIQPSHPLSSPSPPAPNPSQHQSLFQWVNFLHEVAKVLEFQL